MQKASSGKMWKLASSIRIAHDSERRRASCVMFFFLEALSSLWKRLIPVYQSDRIRQSTMLPAKRMVGQISQRNRGAERLPLDAEL